MKMKVLGSGSDGNCIILTDDNESRKITPQERYDRQNTVRICGLKLNKKTDKEIIEKLKSVPNKQGYIKNLIKNDINN